MEDPAANAILRQYFRRLEEALGGVPVERRTQIVEDVRAHVAEYLDVEPDWSDATVMTILDRVGDPDEIAREALADEGAASADREVTHPTRVWGATKPAGVVRARLGLAAAAVLVAGVVALVGVVTLSAGQASSDSTKTLTKLVDARVRQLTSHGGGLNANGWLPASAVSGGGGVDTSDCVPQTMSGSESAVALEADATKAASGTVDGHSWSVWSKRGKTGATGLEEGGVVIDGVAHGLCPGFPNPAEMELLEPSGGGDGIAYGVIGYPGTAKANIYQSTAGTFDVGRLLASTTAQNVNGVGFFITTLSRSGCKLSALELNSASKSYAAEHNLGFSTSHCTDGNLVPISDSQGIWQLPRSDFPNKFQTPNGGGRAGGAAPA